MRRPVSGRRRDRRARAPARSATARPSRAGTPPARTPPRSAARRRRAAPAAAARARGARRRARRESFIVALSRIVSRQHVDGLTVTVVWTVMTDFLDEKRKEIQSRLKELKPLVDEYQPTRGRGARARRRGVEARPLGAAAAPRRARGAPPTAAAAARAGSGTRALQALELVRARPGHHDPRARRGDGDQAELPLSRDADPRRGGSGGQVRARVAQRRVRPSPSSLRRRRAPPSSSSTVLSIRACENSGTSSPCTISYSPSGAAARERGDDPLLDAVGAVGRHRHRDPVAVGGAVHPVVHVVDRGVGGRRRGRGAARLDDLGAALADARDVLVGDPRLVADRVPRPLDRSPSR